MSPEENEAILRTIETVGAVCLGGILAVLGTHWLTVDRERRSGLKRRKLDFLAFLDGWRYEIGRTRLVTGGFEGREDGFGNFISLFVQQASLIKWDIKKRKRAEFTKLCSAITDIEHPTVYSPKDREKVKSALDSIAQFIDSHI